MSKKILIVDDEKELIEILETLLEEHFVDVEIDTVCNGLDAFISCQKKQYDLIITDYKMPFMNGAALTIGIRTRENLCKNTHIVVLSGYIDEELKATLNPQKVTFLSKPFEEHVLIEKITSFLI